MDVFVTGGTRVLGAPVLRLLTSRGHRVRALSRSSDGDGVVRELGGDPVRCSLFDRAELCEAVAGSEAVLHLATRIPPTREALRREAWAENDRIRIEGTRNLVDAALAAGSSTFVYPSVVFVYPDRGDDWIDAAAAAVRPTGLVRSTLVAEEEVSRFTGSGGRGVVLRMGAFYGPTAPSAVEMVTTARRRGLAVVVGPVGAYQSVIWVDDAASAVVAALERGPAGVYDVVDDEPLTRGEVVAALAAAVGRRRLVRVPWSLLRVVGGSAAGTIGRSQRVSNRRFREATGWEPSVRDARAGLRRLAAELS
jgi:nucleoside-diphosphate-sugar epimerase